MQRRCPTSAVVSRCGVLTSSLYFASANAAKLCGCTSNSNVVCGASGGILNPPKLGGGGGASGSTISPVVKFFKCATPGPIRTFAFTVLSRKDSTTKVLLSYANKLTIAGASSS